MRSVVLILGFLPVVLSINASGQMVDDFAVTDEEDPVTFSVTDNDNVFLPQPNTVDLNTSIPGRQTSITTNEGTYTANNSGDVTFNPENDFFGSSAIQYSMNYGFFGLTVGTAMIRVTVNGINDRPVTEDDVDITTDEDVSIVINVLSNDSDPDDGINPATIEITDPQGGTFIANSAGEVTFTPTPEFSGRAEARYTVRDFAGERSNRSDIEVRVNAVNDPPVAVDDKAITDEGQSIVIRILDNDYDVDGSIVPSSVLITNVNGGSFNVSNNGQVTFTPAPGYSQATANYTVQDDDGLGSKSATITVTINILNDLPIATNDVASMSEDGSPLFITVLANDRDPDGTLNPATVVVTNPVNGTFAASSSGIVTYTPTANFYGVASAKYTVKDNEGGISNEATITVTVNAVNDLPLFDPIADQRVLKNAGTKTVTITGITAGPLETETLTFKATSGSPGLVPNPTITYNGTASTATLTYKPQPNQSGTAVITVEVTDQGGGKFKRTFEIDVIEVEFTSVPITIAVPGQLYEYSIKITPVPETLTIVATQKPAWTTLVASGKNEAKLRGTPPGNAPLNNPVTLQLKDGSAVLDQQQFTIALNRAPTVSSFGLVTKEDSTKAFQAEDFENAFNDPDNQALSQVMFTKVPRHGKLKLGNTELVNGAKVAITSIANVTYNPNPNENGRDTLYWKGSDGYVFSNEAYVHFVIQPANDLPVITYIETENLEYELGSEVPIKLTAGITIKDDDDILLSGAEIRINFQDYERGKEVLSFKDTLNIEGDFDPDAGVLILSGSSTVANYQAALRIVKYNYVNLDQVNLRTERVYITVSDGESSAPKWRTIGLTYNFKDLDIPSAFSPNGDRANEAWLITSPNTTDGTVPYTQALIRVYNKRGLLVYEAKGFEKPWDGTFHGSALPVDTYYYTIDLHYNRVRYKGVVTILR